MLEPRRIAARMAAERMASLLAEKVGGTIGRAPA
jgi:ATP-dependent helicase HrpB